MKTRPLGKKKYTLRSIIFIHQYPCDAWDALWFIQGKKHDLKVAMRLTVGYEVFYNLGPVVSKAFSLNGG